MNITDRIFPSSLALPAYPRDYIGRQVLSGEYGTDQVCPWIASGGEEADAWVPLGYSYIGPTATLPSASDMRVGARALIVEAAVGGLTRPPALGTNMNRLELEVRYLSDSATKAWRPRGAQTLFSNAGANGSELQTFTSVAATGIVSEFAQLPAGLPAQLIGCELYWKVWMGRTTPVGGTVTAALTVGPTPGTIGTTLDFVAAVPANVAGVAELTGSVFIAAAALAEAEEQLAPQAAANMGVTGRITSNWAVAQTLQLSFSSATVGDIFTLLDYSIGIR